MVTKTLSRSVVDICNSTIRHVVCLFVPKVWSNALKVDDLYSQHACYVHIYLSFIYFCVNTFISKDFFKFFKKSAAAVHSEVYFTQNQNSKILDTGLLFLQL